MHLQRKRTCYSSVGNQRAANQHKHRRIGRVQENKDAHHQDKIRIHLRKQIFYTIFFRNISTNAVNTATLIHRSQFDEQGCRMLLCNKQVV
jgi:hypothetical protein